MACAHIRIGSDGTKMCSHLIRHPVHRLEVLAVYDKLCVVVAAGGHRSNETITGRCAAGAYCHTVYILHLPYGVGHSQDTLCHYVRVILSGEITFHYELLIVEVGEEHLLEAAHPYDTCSEKHNRTCNSYPAVADKPFDKIAHPHVELSRGIGCFHLLHCALRKILDPTVGTYGHLYKGQYPTYEEADAYHKEEIAGKLSYRSWSHIDGEEGASRDNCGAEQGESRIASDAVEIDITRQDFLSVYEDTVHNHHRVVDQHTHRHDECPERDTLQCSA